MWSVGGGYNYVELKKFTDNILSTIISSKHVVNVQ